MNRLSATATALSLLSAVGLAASGALAADLPSRATPHAPWTPPTASPLAYNWSGFYAGMHAGYAWNSFRRGAGGLIGNPSGFTAGGQIGFNHQMDSFVVGLEGDLSWNSGVGKRAFPGPVTTEGKVNWAGSIRARAGFAADRALVYATGGYAFGNVKAAVFDTTIPQVFSSSTTRHGWTAGGGIEYAFTDKVSARAEYLYSNLGSKTIFAAPYTTRSGVTRSVLRAGVNYHF